MAQAASKTDLNEDDVAELIANAEKAADYLKVLSNEGRLMILCHLVEGERSVTELERLLAVRQPTVSQMLARLRLEGLVETRREGKAVFYRLTDDRARHLLEVIHDIFCARRKD
ncbi:MAG: metalloregulator ArsR/SmtB family transcription factor [Hyphomicrobiales bacterium]|nr:metalloregulator ArsR/SmtB family transcription factor [Hyphomicrobiales bacterium]